MKNSFFFVVVLAWSLLSIESADAQLPTVKWAAPPLANSFTYSGWIYNYSAGSTRYWVGDTVSVQIMDGPFSTNPSVTFTFDKSHNEGDDFEDIVDLTGDGVRDILIVREKTEPGGFTVPYGFRIVDGATGNTVWTFDDPNLIYTFQNTADLDHDGKIELVVSKQNADYSNYQILVYATNGTALSVPEAGNTVPVTHTLSQNYPNPFNPSTTISYRLSGRENVSITIYDVLGRVIKQFALGEQEAGTHSMSWDGRNEHGTSVAGGTYFYQARFGEYLQSKKMLLLK